MKRILMAIGLLLVGAAPLVGPACNNSACPLSVHCTCNDGTTFDSDPCMAATGCRDGCKAHGGVFGYDDGGVDGDVDGGDGGSVPDLKPPPDF